MSSSSGFFKRPLLKSRNLQCGVCEHSLKEQHYVIYNLILSGMILPLIGFLGLIGNGLSAFVYSRPGEEHMCLSAISFCQSKKKRLHILCSEDQESDLDRYLSYLSCYFKTEKMSQIRFGVLADQNPKGIVSGT